MTMQKPVWNGVLILGILLAVFVLIAGCTDIYGAWYCYSGSPTNGQVAMIRSLQLNRDMSYTMVSKTCTPSATFGQCNPGPDQVVTGTWEDLGNDMGKLNLPVYGGQSSDTAFNNYAIIQYQPGIPRLILAGGVNLFYRNQDDWARSTRPDGSPVPA